MANDQNRTLSNHKPCLAGTNLGKIPNQLKQIRTKIRKEKKRTHDPETRPDQPHCRRANAFARLGHGLGAQRSHGALGRYPSG
jgi:hypothetical protein